MQIGDWLVMIATRALESWKGDVLTPAVDYPILTPAVASQVLDLYLSSWRQRMLALTGWRLLKERRNELGAY